MRLTVIEPEPAHGGGSEAVVLSLARGLARRGHEIVLLHDRDGSMLPDYEAFAVGTMRQRLPGFALRAPLTTMRGLISFAGAVRRSRAQAVVCSHLGYLRHAAVAHRAIGVPFLFHLGLPCVGDSVVLRWAYRNLGIGIAPSAHNAASWNEGGWPTSALRVIPNWVDSNRFKPCPDRASQRLALGLPTLGRYVLFMGRICEQKGVSVLLRAFAGLGRGYEDVTLLLTGGIAAGYASTLEAELSAMSGACRSRVLVHGVTARPEDYYGASDLVCVPSLGDESFGLAVVEAMACAVPVLTSELGITHEILGSANADLLREPGAVAHWTTGLRTWLDDPELRRRCGASLRERAVELYGAESGLKAYEVALARLIETTMETPS